MPRAGDGIAKVVEQRSVLQRSNSHEQLPLRSLGPIVHSIPTAHGAGPLSFAARDDASMISTSNQHIASSPFENVTSALIVLPENFGVERRTMSIVEERKNVGRTKDLNIPLTFLPGEDDVKLREEIVLCNPKQKVRHQGELILTKFRLVFVKKTDELVQVLVDVPLGMISQIVKIGGKTRGNLRDRGAYGIEILCKDLRHFSFANEREQPNQRRNLVETLNRIIFPFSLRKADVTNPLEFFSSFFAWNYKTAVSPKQIDEGWNLYDKIDEYTRMGIHRHGDPHWRIDTKINENYELCDTYPNVLVVPSNFYTERLKSVANFRSRNRIPVLSWYARDRYMTICRSSQPLTGLNRRNHDDVDYLGEIANTNVESNSRLVILDARPKVNAIANKANGGGYEDYPNCDLEFHNIQNIHVMRESLNKLYSFLRSNISASRTSFIDLDHSQWLIHIRAILTSANRVVSLIHQDKRSVLIHCSDGWDRTAQLTSLSMLMLDGYYRTLKGFLVLIEKEWISFGHKFFCRIGHGDKHYDEQSPVFLQFLDCTYQLVQQFPSSFEFTELLLLNIADSLYSCQYGTFLLNSDEIRREMRTSEFTMSTWTTILDNSNVFLSRDFDEKNSKRRFTTKFIGNSQY